jgi:outer membrane protein TolC
VVVAYAPDVFGGTRRQVGSLMATAELQRYQVEATYLTPTSNVVAAAVQEASLRGQIAATEEIIKIQTESLGILRKQFELGQVAAADVAAVEATLAQAEATLPPVAQAIGSAARPADRADRSFAEPGAGREVRARRAAAAAGSAGQLPSKLVEQRPDIQSAEAQLHAASASIGVAIAAQLPQFALTGNAGTTTRGASFVSVTQQFNTTTSMEEPQIRVATAADATVGTSCRRSARRPHCAQS